MAEVPLGVFGLYVAQRRVVGKSEIDGDAHLFGLAVGVRGLLRLSESLLGLALDACLLELAEGVHGLFWISLIGQSGNSEIV